MHFRMRTSKEAGDILLYLKNVTPFTPNILAQMAICLSLRNSTPVGDLHKNILGIEFNRHTLTGEHDTMFKAMITQHCGFELTDEEYFPKYIKRHLDRGIHELKNIYDYSGNYEKFILNLTKLVTEVLL